jgi:hypothetical protein
MTILEAIDELIAYYSIYAPEDIPPSYAECYKGRRNCPLCEACTVGLRVDCDLCPWFIFEGAQCIGSGRHYGHDTAAERIKRLQGWREALT